MSIGSADGLMVDATIIGGGARARDCGEILSRTGFSLAHSFEVDTGSSSPIILGEVQGGYQLAREAISAGRHLLIADTQVLTPERLTLLLEHRRPGQALFVWSDRRSHAGYRFMAGLRESDNTWRPRYIRQEVLGTEHTTTALMRWRTLEALALLNSIARQDPKTVSATAVVNRKRNAPDLVNLTIDFNDVRSHVIVGLGEALDRRETLLASDTRKVYVDELNASMPIRIIDDEPVSANSARWLSSMAPSSEELARQQCLGFLDATVNANLSAEEAALWNRSLATLASMEQALAQHGPVEVVIRQETTRFRSIGGLAYTPPSVA
jgi:hypothetical protein